MNSLRETPGERWIPQWYLGGAVAAELLVARTPDTACIVRHIAADPRGFSFTLVVRLREPVENLAREMQALCLPPRPRSGTLSVAVAFSDGRTFTTYAEQSDEDTPPLEAGAGVGGSEGWALDFWVPVLPDSGEVTFTCKWHSRGVSGTARLPSALLVAAAQQAQPLFG
jgi:hypothetical protein